MSTRTQTRAKRKRSTHSNHHKVFIFSLEEMDKLVEAASEPKRRRVGRHKPKRFRQAGAGLLEIKELWKKLRRSAEVSANYKAVGDDIVLLARLVSELGLHGAKAVMKSYNGKVHVVLKGRPGMRTTLTAAKYRLDNIKVVKIGLGRHGAINAAYSGGLLTIGLVTIYRVVDWVLRDSATMAEMFGNLAMDIVKIGIATGAAIATAVFVAAKVSSYVGTAVAFGPLVFAIAVGLIVSMLLNWADESLGLTKKVIAELEDMKSKTEKAGAKAHDTLTDFASHIGRVPYHLFR